MTQAQGTTAVARHAAVAQLRDVRTTFTGVGMLVHVALVKPLAHAMAAVEIAREVLRVRRPELDLARFDWTDAVAQIAAGFGRYTVHVKYRREGAAAGRHPTTLLPSTKEDRP